MNELKLFVETTLPAILLTCYIYWCDRYQREPIREIWKGVRMGFGAVVLSTLISVPSLVLGLYAQEYDSLMGAVRQAIFGAAIPEETMKLLMLWLLVRHNKHFDERMDAIVYSVSVSMGFALLENIAYVFTNIDEGHQVALMRAIFSVPGHYVFAVMMGYYYGLVHFEPKRFAHLRPMVWAAPVLSHAIFDALLMARNVVSDVAGGIIFVVFMAFCIFGHRYALRRTKRLLHRDEVLLWGGNSHYQK